MEKPSKKRTNKSNIIEHLANRDGLVCGICGGSLCLEYHRWVLRKCLIRHRGKNKIKRKSINMDIDHIIPRKFAKGEHPFLNRENLQLTHRNCNNKKGCSYPQHNLP